MITLAVLNTIYQLSRAGLADLAKDIKNTPAMIAEAATHLETWRAEMEKQAKAAEAAQQAPATETQP